MPVMWILLLIVTLKGYSSHLDLYLNTLGDTDVKKSVNVAEATIS